MSNSSQKVRRASDLGVAQLVARYLGVVEAASSSLVTQIKIGNRKILDFLLYSGFLFYPLTYLSDYDIITL